MSEREALVAVTVRLSPDLHAAVAAAAERDGIPVAVWIRQRVEAAVLPGAVVVAVDPRALARITRRTSLTAAEWATWVLRGALGDPATRELVDQIQAATRASDAAETAATTRVPGPWQTKGGER